MEGGPSIPPIVGHRISIAVVAAALVATAGVFTFARPAYHQPCRGCKTLRFAGASPPVDGWRWSDPSPGFHFGDYHDEWRVLSRVQPSDVPAGAGILTASTNPPGDTEAIYWSDGCLGVRLGDGARTRLCNPQAAAVFVADAVPRSERNWYVFFTGVVRSDVTRVTVQARKETEIVMSGARRVVEPMPPQILYDRATPGWWGGFEGQTAQPVPWDATLRVYGRHGLIATTRVRPAHAGDALYCASALRGACGISEHRRS
jgi:hypothetical protein